MKKLFEELELDVIRFGAADILTASAAEETPKEETTGEETPPAEEEEPLQPSPLPAPCPPPPLQPGEYIAPQGC